MSRSQGSRKIMGIRSIVLFLGAALLFFVPHQGHAGPSFDCAKATAPDEQAICADKALSDLDQLINNAYRNFEPQFREKKDVARDILKDRAACGSDAACIASVLADALTTYTASLEEDQKPDSWPQTYAYGLMGRKAAAFAKQGNAEAPQLPDTPGQCAMTRITELTTRFGEPVTYDNADSGTAITFANGSSQVSYDRNGLYDLKTGDKVVLCLMSIPHDCPKDDTRGRMYFGMDVKTKAQWQLPDSQHMCGGA